MIIYDDKKAQALKLERNIDIDEIVELIIDKKYLDILEHPKRGNQQIFILSYKDYIHVVPFVVDKNDDIVIKTVFPSRNFHKIYKESFKMKNKLDSNEQIIEDEAENYRKVSDKKKRKIESILMKSSKKKVITLRLNDDDLVQIKTIAINEGIPYQTLISSVLHKYINNRFVDKNEVLKISDLSK